MDESQQQSNSMSSMDGSLNADSRSVDVRWQVQESEISRENSRGSDDSSNLDTEALLSSNKSWFDRNVRQSTYYKTLAFNDAFRLLWIGVTISEFGVWFTYLSCLRLIADANPSAWGVTLYMCIFVVTQAIMASPSGVIADKYNRFDVLLLSDITRVLIVLTYGFPLMMDEPYVLLLVISGVHAVMESFVGPAESALIPVLVQKHEIAVANSIMTVTWCCMLFIGSAAGGLAVSSMPPMICFCIDSLTYMFGCWFIWKARSLNPALGKPNAQASKHSDVMLEQVPTQDPEEFDQEMGAVVVTSRDNQLNNGNHHSTIDAHAAILLGPTDVMVDQISASLGDIQSSQDESAMDNDDNDNDNDENSQPDEIIITEDQDLLKKHHKNVEDVGEWGITEGESFWQSIKVARNFFVWQPYIMVLVMGRALGNLIWGNTDILNILLIKARIVHFDGILGSYSAVLGLTFAVEGVFIGVAPAMVMHFTKNNHVKQRTWVALGFLFASFGLLIMPGTHTDPTLDLFLLFIGNAFKAVGIGLIALLTDTLIQQLTPNEVLGRVQSVKWMVRNTCALFTMVGTAIAIDQYNVSADTLQYVVGTTSFMFFLVQATYFTYLTNTRQKRLDQGLTDRAEDRDLMPHSDVAIDQLEKKQPEKKIESGNGVEVEMSTIPEAA